MPDWFVRIVLAEFVALRAVAEWVWGLHYGTVPDWLAGCGAITALLFAALAVRAANRTNKQQNEQLRRLEEDQRRRDKQEHEAQARSVVIWFIRPPTGEYTVLISNVSLLPVTKAVIVVKDCEGLKYPPVSLPFIPTERYFKDEGLNELVGSILPKLTQNGLAGLQEDALALSFTDMNGNRWHRGMGGGLVPLHPEQLSIYHEVPKV